MLALKSSYDDLISLRHFANSLKTGLENIKMRYELIKGTATEKIDVTIEHYVFAMEGKIAKIHEIGSDEFDYEKIKYANKLFNEDYKEILTNYINKLKEIKDKKLLESEKYNLLLVSLLNQKNRDMEDEVRLSSLKRNEKVQEIINSTAISTVSTVLRTEWSGAYFINKYKDAVKISNYALAKLQDDFVSTYARAILYGEEENYDRSANSVRDRIEKKFYETSQEREEILYQDKVERIEQLSTEEVISTYNDIFIPNDESRQIIANAEKLVHSAISRSKSKSVLFKEIEEINERMLNRILNQLGLI